MWISSAVDAVLQLHNTWWFDNHVFLQGAKCSRHTSELDHL